VPAAAIPIHNSQFPQPLAPSPQPLLFPPCFLSPIAGWRRAQLCGQRTEPITLKKLGAVPHCGMLRVRNCSYPGAKWRLEVAMPSANIAC
jgi:hypothetical protein